MLIDPYAPLIKGRACFGVRDEFERFQEKACPVLEITSFQQMRLQNLPVITWRMTLEHTSFASARVHGKRACRCTAQVGSVFRGTFALDEPEFDWGAGYARPGIPPQDLVIYEMGVRSFTADASAGVPPEDAGTSAACRPRRAPGRGLGCVFACKSVCCCWTKPDADRPPGGAGRERGGAATGVRA